MAEGHPAEPAWLETGVPSLDRVLGGGLLRGTLALIIGAPGTGKTILAQQVAFYHAARGSTTLFLTGYSENHQKLLAHSQGLSFFAPEAVGQQVHFISLLDLLREGVDDTEDAIVELARSHGASLVVLDGFRGMRQLIDDRTTAHFLYSLGTKLAILGVTTFILAEGNPDESAHYPELTVCDAILALRHEFQDGREQRRLMVVKARGASSLPGVHPFTIDHTGITVFPRFESVVAHTDPVWVPDRAGLGIAELDALLDGGVSIGTTTLVAGSPGMGKTLLGLQFLAEGARLGEPVLFLGFMESVAQLREKASSFGMDLAGAEAAGLFRFLVLPGYDLDADQVAAVFRDDIERRDVRRLVIDSAAQLERSVGHQSRVPDFMAALVNYLRGREVTTYLTIDIPTIVGPTLDFAGTPLSVIAENFLLLRNVEYRGRLHRLFSVLKMRFSGHERAIYEYTITVGQGFQVLGPAPLGEGLLTGMARPLAGPPAPDQPGGSQGAPWPRS